MIKLTIITPCRNGGEALRECLESVASQADPRIEHIVQDACSTDGTVDMLKEYAAKYPHLSFVSERDSGQSNAMNRALARARGEFIGILNADDSYEPSALATVLPLLVERGGRPLFLHGALRIIYTEIKRIEIQRFPKLRSLDIYYEKFPWNPAGYFYSKSLHGKIGPYDEVEHYAMDLKFLFRAFELAELRYVDKILGTYNIHPGAKTYEAMKEGSAGSRQINLMRIEYAKCSFWKKRLLKAYRIRMIVGYKLQRWIKARTTSSV